MDKTGQIERKKGGKNPQIRVSHCPSLLTSHGAGLGENEFVTRYRNQEVLVCIGQMMVW